MTKVCWFFFYKEKGLFGSYRREKIILSLTLFKDGRKRRNHFKMNKTREKNKKKKKREMKAIKANSSLGFLSLSLSLFHLHLSFPFITFIMTNNKNSLKYKANKPEETQTMTRMHPSMKRPRAPIACYRCHHKKVKRGLQ